MFGKKNRNSDTKVSIPNFLKVCCQILEKKSKITIYNLSVYDL